MRRDISADVMAGGSHDHLFVEAESEQALTVLKERRVPVSRPFATFAWLALRPLWCQADG
ncbi:hypothetical protein BOX17_11980 [Halomonas aestuarii]|uniref:Uncharacterized protein n=1 Tax=Halomonas aestuarii TaxID=1897729 RepID=A0A1J0VHX5_9GAMM|nr:hypothetical protein BOX17_11980 [Halomonas aestuarii]